MKRPKRKPPKMFVWQFRMAKLDVKPGDTVVLQTDLMLTNAQVAELRKNLDAQLKSLKLRRSIILTAGLRIGVIRKTS